MRGMKEMEAEEKDGWMKGEVATPNLHWRRFGGIEMAHLG